MAKKRKRPLSQSPAARARREVLRVKKAASAQAKRRPKIRQYNQLAKDFIEKQRQQGDKRGVRELRDSAQLKKIVRDLKRGTAAQKKAALEQTVRGDKVRDWRPYIKRWKAGEL